MKHFEESNKRKSVNEFANNRKTNAKSPFNSTSAIYRALFGDFAKVVFTSAKFVSFMQKTFEGEKLSIACIPNLFRGFNRQFSINKDLGKNISAFSKFEKNALAILGKLK